MGMSDNDDDVLRECMEYWNKLVQICFAVLKNQHDAEDAAAQAIAKALAQRPAEFTKGPAAWLTTVAKNDARDLLKRNSARSSVEQAVHVMPVADLARAAGIPHDTGRLFREISKYLTRVEQSRLELYVTVAIRESTERELAEREGIPFERLRYLRRSTGRAVKEAAVAICLIADPPSGCDAVAEYRKRLRPSPDLRRKVTGHVARCTLCGAKGNAFAGQFLAVPVAAFVALQAWLARTSKPAAITAAAFVVAVAFSVFYLDPTPAPERSIRAAPPAWVPATTSTTTTATTTTPTTTTTAPSRSAPPVTTTTTTPAPAPPPAHTTTPATTTGDGGRSADVPVIGKTSLRYRRIVATERTGCDEPTRSTVGAVVTGATTVWLRTVVAGNHTDVPMSRDGKDWWAMVGPYPRAGQKVEVFVVAVSGSGAEVSKPVGAVCVTSCHRSSSEQRQ